MLLVMCFRASVYQMLGKSKEAVECYEQQVEAVDEETSKMDICSLHGNLGISYR